MPDGHNSVRRATRVLTEVVLRAYDGVWRINTAIDGALERRSRRTLRAASATVTATATIAAVGLAVRLVPVVAAQGGGADDIMCGTGAGTAVTLLFGVLGLGLVLISAFRGATGLNDMGSQRSDKKRQGQDKLKGAGMSLSGAFVLIAFPALLQAIGVNTFSCVSFSPF